MEETSGIPFSTYIKQKITDPLRMSSSGFDYDANAKKNLVTSYLQKDGTLKGYKDYFSLNYPAGGFHATAEDMGNYIRMYLNGGSLASSQLSKPETIEKMWMEIYQNFPESPYGWGLGFEFNHWRGRKVMGHGGDVLGFATDLRLLPEEHLGIYMSFNSSSIPGSVSKEFLNKFWNRLLKKLFPEVLIVENKVKEMSTSILPLSAYEGTYRFTRYAHNTLDKLAVFIGFAPEITIEKKSDSLVVKDWGYSFYPTGNFTFFAPSSNKYVAFGKNSKNEIGYFYLTGTEGYEKLEFYDTVKFQMIWMGIVLMLSFVSILRFIRGLIFKKYVNSSLDKLQALISVLLFLFLSVVGYSLATTDPQAFLYGVPTVLGYVLYVPFIVIGLILWCVFLQVIPKPNSTKTVHVIVTIAFGFFIWWLYNWNLLGFNY